jgi:phosphatidylglycerol:prolipoprotein diacylglycerol transferase
VRPILIRFADTSFIYSGHFMLFLGALAAIVVLTREMKRSGERPEEIYGLILLLFVSTIAGGRLLYALDFNDEFQYTLVGVLKFWSGGMTLYGGALLALVTFVLFIRWRQLDFWRIADLFTPPVILFVAFARGGCILMGCCYGKQCDPHFPLAMTFTDPISLAPTDVPLYPTQALFATAGLLVFVAVRRARKRKGFKGETALLGVSLYSLLGFTIEFLRADRRVLYEIGGATLSQNQIIGAVVFLSVTGLYFYRRGRARDGFVFD